ncbi:hypothetical protein [Stenotrophomonas sp.]|uniref:hypothetical protein n=1 Tax=Stenotrophomonas sp. TaxID=69392 RepID=UPI00289800D5|nr:hypothetical protein [Stenotrophomonas sp.]
MSDVVERYSMLAVLAITCGCSSVSQPSIRSGHDPLFPEGYLETQSLCIDAWDEVIKEWVVSTGGFRKTIDETRHGIAMDKSSRLSRIIQKVWSARGYQGDEGWISVTDKLNSAIAEVAADGGIPRVCSSYSWLHPLWVEVPGVFSEGAEQALLAAAPPEASGSSRALSRWLLLSLLIRQQTVDSS